MPEDQPKNDTSESEQTAAASEEEPKIQPQEGLKVLTEDESEIRTKRAQNTVLHTMKSDINRFFKTTRPTLSQMMGRSETKRSDSFTQRPGIKKIYLFAGLGVLLLTGAGFAVFKIANRGSEESARQIVKLSPPAPFFAAETSRTISIKNGDRQQFALLMQDSINEREREGTIKKILIKLQDGSGERFAGAGDFFDLLRIKPPQNLSGFLDEPLMAFIYYGTDGGRVGFAVKIRERDRVLSEMIAWEPSLILDFEPMFFGETPGQILSLFEDRSYRNIDWRFIKLSQQKDFGLAYAVFPARNILMVTTGKDGMESVINRLFEAK